MPGRKFRQFAMTIRNQWPIGTFLRCRRVNDSATHTDPTQRRTQPKLSHAHRFNSATHCARLAKHRFRKIWKTSPKRLLVKATPFSSVAFILFNFRTSHHWLSSEFSCVSTGFKESNIVDWTSAVLETSRWPAATRKCTVMLTLTGHRRWTLHQVLFCRFVPGCNSQAIVLRIPSHLILIHHGGAFPQLSSSMTLHVRVVNLRLTGPKHFLRLPMRRAFIASRVKRWEHFSARIQRWRKTDLALIIIIIIFIIIIIIITFIDWIEKGYVCTLHNLQCTTS